MLEYLRVTTCRRLDFAPNTRRDPASRPDGIYGIDPHLDDYYTILPFGVTDFHPPVTIGSTQGGLR